jgi:hypothetical protein
LHTLINALDAVLATFMITFTFSVHPPHSTTPKNIATL